LLLNPIYLDIPYFSSHYPSCYLYITQYRDFFVVAGGDWDDRINTVVMLLPELHEFYDKPLFIIQKPASRIQRHRFWYYPEATVITYYMLQCCICVSYACILYTHSCTLHVYSISEHIDTHTCGCRKSMDVGATTPPLLAAGSMLQNLFPC